MLRCCGVVKVAKEKTAQKLEVIHFGKGMGMFHKIKQGWALKL